MLSLLRRECVVVMVCGGDGVMAGMICCLCLIAVLSFIVSAMVSCEAWRDACDVLCFLAMLVVGMVFVFVFTV